MTQSLLHVFLDPQFTLALNLCSGIIVITKFIPGLRIFSLFAQGILVAVELLRGLLEAKEKHTACLGKGEVANG